MLNSTGERHGRSTSGESHQGTSDFEALCLDLYTSIYGKALRYNAQAGTFRFPSGAVLEVNQLEGPGDYAKYQGRSFTLLLIDEAGQYPIPDLLDRLRSNLRGPAGMPIRCCIAANPGDVGHQWIAQRYVFRADPWTAFHEEKSQRLWMYAPSTYAGNPFIDSEGYRQQLEASCPADRELLRAWLVGDWTIARGAYFGSCLAEDRNAVNAWAAIPPDWHSYLAMDFGSSAPAVVYVVARSPGGTGPDGKFYPRDSLILCDELATNVPGELNKGMGYTVPVLAEHIRRMCKRWNVPARGCADDSIFNYVGSASGCIADEFLKAGVVFGPGYKGDRVGGWQIMRRLLQDAGKPDKPGLFIARHCEYFWATVPYLGRDPRYAEDLDSRGPDHAADCARYAAIYQRREVTMTEMFGPKPSTDYRADNVFELAGAWGDDDFFRG